MHLSDGSTCSSPRAVPWPAPAPVPPHLWQIQCSDRHRVDSLIETTSRHELRNPRGADMIMKAVERVSLG